MLYIASDEAQWEALEIGLATGSMLSTIIGPELRDETVCSLEPSTITPFANGLHLALAETTGSWVLLEPDEAAIAAALRRPQTLSDLTRGLTVDAQPNIRGFLTRLYQRGLLRLDNVPGIQPDLFRNGALHHDSYLVEIFVTQKCNLACKYCSAQAGADMPHLDPDLARRAIDQIFLLPQKLPVMIELAGGEPLANFGLFCDLVHYVEKKSLESARPARLFTQTNGTLVTSEIAEFLKAHEISVGVSIDGPPEIHDALRPLAGGQASFDKVLKGMSILREHGVRFGIITVLSRQTLRHPARMVRFYNDLGSRSVKLNPVNLIGDADSAWDTVGVTGQEYFEFLDELVDATLQTGVVLREGNLSECIRNLIFRVHEYRCMRSNCGAGQTFFVVDAKGDVFPCAHSTAIESWRLGSVKDAERAGGFVALGERSDAVNAIASRLVDDMPATSSCPWRHFCEGGCAVNAFKQNGMIGSRDPLCSFYEKMYPRLLERLATSPTSFQTLLDSQLGSGIARVESFSLRSRFAASIAPSVGT